MPSASPLKSYITTDQKCHQPSPNPPWPQNLNPASWAHIPAPALEGPRTKRCLCCCTMCCCTYNVWRLCMIWRGGRARRDDPGQQPSMFACPFCLGLMHKACQAFWSGTDTNSQGQLWYMELPPMAGHCGSLTTDAENCTRSSLQLLSRLGKCSVARMAFNCHTWVGICW